VNVEQRWNDIDVAKSKELEKNPFQFHHKFYGVLIQGMNKQKNMLKLFASL
jgi:hypothetical protein